MSLRDFHSFIRNEKLGSCLSEACRVGRGNESGGPWCEITAGVQWPERRGRRDFRRR